jgi:hypothetical protein
MDDNYDLNSKSGKRSGKISRMRNLAQYKNLSDDEFEKAVAPKEAGIEQSRVFEDRIAKKLQEFEDDYDLSDLKINDRDTLRALIQAQISLEDYEQHMFKLRSGGVTDDIIFASDKLSKIMSDLRGDISKFQFDLNITRKVRKSDRDVSVLAYIDDLKEKAHKFYESKMSYIFCPKCDMLLGTIWTMFPDDSRNKIALVCGRTYPDGTKCGEKVIVGTQELLKNRGTNSKTVTPESMI